MHEHERLSSRRVWMYRAILVALGVTWVAVCCIVTEPDAQGSLGPWALARNVLGFSGIGLGLTTVVGPRLAWTGPLAFALIVLTLAGNLQTDEPALIWPLVASTARPAWVAAISLFFIGAVAYTALGTRENGDEL